MTKINDLIYRAPQKDYYTLIGNGQLLISEIAKYFNPYPEFQIVYLERAEEVIRQEPFVFIKLDGTDYTNTEFSKIHTYFNGAIPDLTDKPYMLKLNNDIVNVKEQGVLKTHYHYVNTSNNAATKYISVYQGQQEDLDERDTILQISDGNNFIQTEDFSFNINDINYIGSDFIIPTSKLVNFYCKMRID